MYQLTALTVNEALGKGIRLILENAVESPSRNGPVLVMPGPTCIEYMDPTDRVLYSRTRDANPFFHLMEAIWMLGGRNDLAFLKQFVSTFGAYSDDGVTLHGAYGHRWREHWGRDQLDDIADELMAHPDSRRCVLGMWNPGADLEKLSSGGRDVPCNTHAYFDIRNGRVNMTVCNRSNDAIFGCFGANLVHFSFLLEYMALRLGKQVGVYRQFTNNLHVYTNVFSTQKLLLIANESAVADEFSTGADLVKIPLWGPKDSYLQFDEEVGYFLDYQWELCSLPFFVDVAIPMFNAWLVRKDRQGTKGEVLRMLDNVKDDAWRKAAQEWVSRRKGD